MFSRFRCQYARTFHYWTVGTRKWSYLRWVSMMDRECCSTLLTHIIWPSSTGFHSRHVLQFKSDCCSTTLCTGTCLHVGFIWWHRARLHVTLLISSQVDKKKIIRLCFICYAWYSRQLGINHFYSFHIHTSPFCLLFHKRRSEWQRKVTFILCSYTIQPWNLNKKWWTPVFMQLSLSLYKF